MILFFNSFMKMENKKRMKALNIQSKNLSNLKIVVNYLYFVFHIEIKTSYKQIKTN